MVTAVMMAVFSATFLVMLGAAVVWNAWRGREATEARAAEAGPALLRSDTDSSISLWALLLKRFHFSGILKARTLEAGLDWSVGRTTWMMLLGGSAVLTVLSRLPFLPLFAVLGLAVAAGLGPYFYILHKRGRRFRAFESQLPDGLDSLARAMRAGHPFSAGMDLLATERPAPVGPEMRRAYDEWKLGSSWDDALDHLAARVPIPPVCIFVAAVKLQSKTGGKLSEVLARLADTLREAASVEDEVRAVSAHGRMTGLILTVLPFGIVGVLMLVNPEYVGTLLAHPIGRNMIAISLGCIFAAHLVIRKLVDIKL